ncbi:hypothetical protein TIMEGRIFFIN_80 [Bacillus phage vB_BspH_TimeGriffin]|nr:hypothetical protein TIMEGRIFFIN_80 [Bacillus phage vB_BspH_TimeGriffin]
MTNKDELNIMVKQVAERYGLECKEDKEQLTIKLENGKIMVVGDEDIYKVLGLTKHEEKETWAEYVGKIIDPESFVNTKYHYTYKKN